MLSFIVINCRVFVSFFIQLTKTFGSKHLVLSNSYHVHKAQIKTVTSTINMIKKIYDIKNYIVHLTSNIIVHVQYIRMLHFSHVKNIKNDH